jgi:hypothetical protein
MKPEPWEERVKPRRRGPHRHATTELPRFGL